MTGDIPIMSYRKEKFFLIDMSEGTCGISIFENSNKLKERLEQEAVEIESFSGDLGNASFYSESDSIKFIVKGEVIMPQAKKIVTEYKVD